MSVYEAASLRSDDTLANLATLMRERAELVQRFLDLHFTQQSEFAPGQERLLEAIRYSALQEGGKRFRPTLAMLTAEALGWPGERVLAYAAAVECVHTYSLIHDDLPAMDNDDLRRGQPTNHKKFDEATAILAGDALLTEAFSMIAENFSVQPELALLAIRELSRASGLSGMVGGQAIDIAAKAQPEISFESLRNLHRLKTGALIRASSVGAAILCGAEPEPLRALSQYSESLGLAFQIADDLLDFDPEKPEAGSYPTLLGVDRARGLLDDATRSCLQRLAGWSADAEPLRMIAAYNQQRVC